LAKSASFRKSGGVARLAQEEEGDRHLELSMRMMARLVISTQRGNLEF